MGGCRRAPDLCTIALLIGIRPDKYKLAQDRSIAIQPGIRQSHSSVHLCLDKEENP